MRTERLPDYPLFGESKEQFERWYLSRFERRPDETEVRQWRTLTFLNILKLPIVDCSGVLTFRDKPVYDFDKIPPSRFAGFKPRVSAN